MLKRFKPFLVPVFFFWLTFFIYLPDINARFVFDFLDFITGFIKYGLFPSRGPGAGLSEMFTIRIITFTWFKLFGWNVWAWHVLCCGLHALNAFLLFQLLKYLYRKFDLSAAQPLAFVTSFLFLILPYQTEAVVWAGDLNYLVVGVFTLGGIYSLLKFYETKRRTFLATYFIMFLSGAFTHELGLFIFPAAMILIAVLALRGFLPYLNANRLFVAGSLAVYLIYFVNRSLSGALIGHYGAGVHLTFKLGTIVPVFILYVFKITFLFAFSPVAWQAWVLHVAEKLSLAFAIFMIVAFVAVAYYAIKFNRKYLLLSALFLLFTLFVFPVLNLYFPYWVKIEADRYCYIPSAFLLGCIVPAIGGLRNVFKYSILCLYLTCSVKFLHYNITSWHEASELQHSLEKDFRWWTAPRVYILNRPDNFRGAYMYRSTQQNAFAPSFLKYTLDSIPATPITEILGYNLNHQADSVIVENAGSSKLRVTLSDWGIWYWWQTLGATGYEDTLVKVTVDDYGHSYVVEFKNKRPGDVVIYSANGKWTEVKNF